MAATRTKPHGAAVARRTLLAPAALTVMLAGSSGAHPDGAAPREVQDTCAIEGRLLDEQGRPIANQAVEVAPPRTAPLVSMAFWNPAATATTDAGGAYRFEGLAPGKYQVGLPPRTTFDRPDGEVGIVPFEVLAVTAGEPVGRADLRVEQGHYISARVEFPERWSARSPWFDASGQGGWTDHFSPSILSPDEVFRLGPFPAGPVTLRARGPYEGPPVDQIEVLAGADDVTLKLSPAVSVNGVIVEGGDMVRSSITLCARYGMGSLVRARPRGIFFHFPHVPWIEPVTLYGVSSDGRAADPIRLPEDAGAWPERFELRLRPGARLRVTLAGDVPDRMSAELVTPDGFQTPRPAQDEDGDGVVELMGPGGPAEVLLRSAAGAVLARRSVDLTRGALVEVRVDLSTAEIDDRAR